MLSWQKRHRLSRKVDECKPLFYGSTATSGLAADCGVSVMDGVVEVGVRCQVFTPHCLRPRPSLLK